jgi:hypothetical protein
MDLLTRNHLPKKNLFAYVILHQGFAENYVPFIDVTDAVKMAQQGVNWLWQSRRHIILRHLQLLGSLVLDKRQQGTDPEHSDFGQLNIVSCSRKRADKCS